MKNVLESPRTINRPNYARRRGVVLGAAILAVAVPFIGYRVNDLRNGIECPADATAEFTIDYDHKDSYSHAETLNDSVSANAVIEKSQEDLNPNTDIYNVKIGDRIVLYTSCSQ